MSPLAPEMDLRLRSFTVESISQPKSDFPRRWLKALSHQTIEAWLKPSGDLVGAHDPEDDAKTPLQETLEREFRESADSVFVQTVVNAIVPPVDQQEALPPATLEFLRDAANQLRQAVIAFRDGKSDELVTPASDVAGDAQQGYGHLTQHLCDHLPDAVQELAGKLDQYYRQDTAARRSQPLVDYIRAAAFNAVSSAVEQTAPRYQVLPDGTLQLTPEQLRNDLMKPKIRLEGCGFSQRTFVVDQHESPVLDTASIPDNTTVVYGAVDEAFVCLEAENISLAQLARLLTEDRPDVVEAAKRLHTRIDVRWTYPPAHNRRILTAGFPADRLVDNNVGPYLTIRIGICRPVAKISA